MSDLLNVDNFIGGVVRRLSGGARHRRQKSNVPLVIATIGYGAGAVGGTNNATTSVVNRDVIANGMKRLFAQEEAFSKPDQTIKSIKTEVVEPRPTIVRVPTLSSLVSQDNASTDENHSKGETFILYILFDTATGTVKRRARIDTGSPNEFISYNTVVRLGAEKDIEPLETDHRWFGVQGESFQARGKLHRSWSCKDSIRTWDTEFFVIDTELFDVLLGRSFCELSGAVYVDRSLLPLHRNRKDADVEANARRVSEDKKKEQEKDNERLLQEEKEKKKKKVEHNRQQESAR